MDLVSQLYLIYIVEFEYNILNKELLCEDEILYKIFPKLKYYLLINVGLKSFTT